MLFPRSLKNPETELLIDFDFALAFFFVLVASGGGVEEAAVLVETALVAAVVPPLVAGVELVEEPVDGVDVPAVDDELEELVAEDVTPEAALPSEGLGTAAPKIVVGVTVPVTDGVFWTMLATVFRTDCTVPAGCAGLDEEVVLDAVVGVIVPAGVRLVGVLVVVTTDDAPFVDPDVLVPGAADNQSTVMVVPSMSADLEADTTVFCVDADGLEPVDGSNKV